MTMPEIFAVFCTPEVDPTIVEDLIDQCRDSYRDNRSMLSLVKDLEQTSFDRPTEKPVSAFATGLTGTTMEDMYEFAKSHFVLERDSTTNIASHAFVILDRDTAEAKNQVERTALIVQFEYEQLESVRVYFKDVKDVLTMMAPSEAYISEWRDVGGIDENGIYKADV